MFLVGYLDNRELADIATDTLDVIARAVAQARRNAEGCDNARDGCVNARIEH